MAATCPTCDSPLCLVCGGCQECGTCDCIEEVFDDISVPDGEEIEDDDILEEEKE